MDGMRRTSCYKKCHTNTVPDRVNKTFFYKRVQKPIRARHEYSWHQQTLTEMVYDEFHWGYARHAVSFQRWWWYEIFKFQLFVIPSCNSYLGLVIPLFNHMVNFRRQQVPCITDGSGRSFLSFPCVSVCKNTTFLY